METIRTQTLVIGGGPGGYVAAIRLAQLGKEVVVVEQENVGGVCLNVGCIPSKALITAASHLDEIRHSADMGIHVDGVTVDFAKMQSWKQSVVSKLTGGVAQLLKGNKVKTMKGSAQFKSPQEVLVISGGVETLVCAEDVIIATGSKPIEIPGFAFDGRRVLSSTHALALTEIPKRMVVIGGGYIGLELGTAYAKLGTKVTVVEAMDQVLPGFDPEMARLLSRRLKQLEVTVLLGAKAKGWQEGTDGAQVTIEQNGTPVRLDCDVVLVTVGRKPHTAGLNLQQVGVTIDANGFVPANDKQQTNVPHIYSIGDVAGQPMLAHKASREGEVAAEVIAGKASAFDARSIPAVVFTDPEIATAGLTEAQATEAGYTPITGRFNFAANGRALTYGNAEGFVKVVADKESQVLLGIHIIGHGASDLIAEATLALEMGAVLDDLSSTIHAHPTLPEALMEAIKAVKGEAIHAMNK
ncbi:MAG: dihydrolipoyl dehydrogenase [Candidatus Sericytochromatia bacterium]|nr:dihydrolipoyl dehydrogenase [Candidatus Sericytochromatia bacterium]